MAAMGPLRLVLGPGFGGDGRLREYVPQGRVWVSGGQVWWQVAGKLPQAGGELVAVLRTLATRLQLPAVGYLAYEAASLWAAEVAVPKGQGPLPLAAWYFLAPDQGRPSQPQKTARLGTFACSLDERSYKAAVAALRRAIGEGEVYQVNLTRRWQAGFSGDPAALFQRLAAAGWPRFAFFLQDPGLDLAILGFSPELFLACRAGWVESWPIKGTWKRWEQALAAGEKEQAELSMIVDLVRHDLGRLCRVGSVQVTHSWRLVEAGEVVHREAVVAGQLRAEVGWQEMLAATFPGGSVTGAPKLAACRLIADLEPVPRSVFCGAYGFLYPNGDLLLAMPIRTGYVAAGTLYVHAGAGIVWDSDEDAEEAETRAKVGRWLAAEGG